MGVYAKIVQSPEYRDAKMKTAAAMLRTCSGPSRAVRPALHRPRRRGAAHGAHDPGLQRSYELHHLDGRGTRPRLDAGTLGILAAQQDPSAADAVEFTGLEAVGGVRSFRGWLEWETPRFQIDSSDAVEIGIDGEAMSLEPPLVFESHAGALRVRIPTHAVGASPAALSVPAPRLVVQELVAIAAGRSLALRALRRRMSPG